MSDSHTIDPLRELSPRRNSTHEDTAAALVAEQLGHFGIDPASEHGRALGALTGSLYAANVATHELIEITARRLSQLDRKDRIAWFNAKRFACFQLAKVLDNLQSPMRKTYQSLVGHAQPDAGRGPYALFDNVTAIFSATPVITRTATYIYACMEWVEDAFKGKEFLHEIYSRLLNPTSISLANHIVDVEAGPLAAEYLAWNFNSGMAAIDATLSHLVGYQDVIVASRNIYGGAYQLLHDWYGKRSNLDVAIHWFDGYQAADVQRALEEAGTRYAERIAADRRIYVYLESPCNPHGHVLDVPGICRLAHARGHTVICDATVGTPFLQPTLRRDDPAERPDFVIHSYTKDLAGYGATTAGVVIGRNEDMFLPKGASVTVTRAGGRTATVRWDETLFWNVYYIKGAFLDADKAYEVINGMRTLELRMLSKCITTIVLANALAAHPRIRVNCSAIDGHPNARLRRENLFLALPAPLFTIDFEPGQGEERIPIDAFRAFFDLLEPVFGLQVSLGQTNTVVLCPALTSHSELSDAALADAGISRTTIRIAVGNEDPRMLLAHLMRSAELSIEPVVPGFARGFPAPAVVDALYESTYVDVHRRYVAAKPKMAQMLE